MSAPVLSVLIPTYAYARYLPEALDSVLTQDFSDMEIICADDASTDETAAIGAAYAQRDRRLRFHQHPMRLGMVANWNWCLQQARGPFVKFLMADDALNVTDALTRMVQVLERHPDVAIVTCARELMDERSHPVGCWNPLGDRERNITFAQWTAQHLEQEPEHFNSIGEPTAVCFRRSQANRGFDPDLRQLVDIEMWLHLMQKGSLYHIPDTLCRFRRHAGQQSMVHQQEHVHRQEEIIICERYAPPEQRDWICYRKIRRMERDGFDAYKPLIQRLRARYTLAQRFRYRLRYRGWRIRRQMARLRRTRLKGETA